MKAYKVEAVRLRWQVDIACSGCPSWRITAKVVHWVSRKWTNSHLERESNHLSNMDIGLAYCLIDALMVGTYLLSKWCKQLTWRKGFVMCSFWTAKNILTRWWWEVVPWYEAKCSCFLVADMSLCYLQSTLQQLFGVVLPLGLFFTIGDMHMLVAYGWVSLTPHSLLLAHTAFEVLVNRFVHSYWNSSSCTSKHCT